MPSSESVALRALVRSQVAPIFAPETPLEKQRVIWESFSAISDLPLLVFLGRIEAFPDGQCENIEQIAEVDKVVSRVIIQGTPQGEFMGVAPSGKRVTTFNGIAIYTIKD